MDFFNPAEIKALLSRHGFHFTKSLGQNFLICRQTVSQFVAAAGADRDMGVLEIGPGIGTLTAGLSREAQRVVAVETDRSLAPLLSETLEDCANVRIVWGDILKTDIRRLCADEFPGLRAVACANLPYYITSPALTALIEAGCFESVVVMVQKEVAERLCARPGTPDYSAFTVYVNFYTRPETLFPVPAGCFLPAPKVDSAVMRLTPRSSPPLPPEDQPFFFRVVRAAFALRRKTLLNALCAAFGDVLDKSALADVLCRCGMDSRIRGETLGIPEFVLLSGELSGRIANL